MTNEDFWRSVASAIAAGFTPESLSTLERYAEHFITGRLVYQRFSPAEQHGCAAGGATHVIASLLAGAEVAPDQLSAQPGSFKRELERGQTQAARIEAWARATGCWIGDADSAVASQLGEQIAQGGEARVYDHGTSVVKVIGLDYFVLPVLALDRISLHNAYFPQTRMTVLGFGRSAEGDFKVIVEQPFIQGERMTDDEIREYAARLGYRLVNPRNWTYATDTVYLSDLHDENVIRSAQGNVFVVDCDIRINTPELKAGGRRRLTNEVLFV